MRKELKKREEKIRRNELNRAAPVMSEERKTNMTMDDAIARHLAAAKHEAATKDEAKTERAAAKDEVTSKHWAAMRDDVRGSKERRSGGEG